MFSQISVCLSTWVEVNPSHNAMGVGEYGGNKYGRVNMEGFEYGGD